MGLIFVRTVGPKMIANSSSKNRRKNTAKCQDMNMAGEWDQDWERWVSILCNALYTLHGDRNRERLFSIVAALVLVPVPFPHSLYEPIYLEGLTDGMT